MTPRHEDKTCPRCGQVFECKTGSIVLCQCAQVSLSREESEYILNRYAECLCAGCTAHA